MQPSLFIARRYLFSKKSHNAINVVSGVSAAAVAVVTAAMLCVMSVLVHAIRLNTLEFSNHSGLTWSGAAFHPFRKTHKTEDK